MILAQIEGVSRPGLVEMFIRSGPMGWSVAGLLVLMSLVSWSIMVGKALYFRRATRHSRDFLEVFRRSQRFSEVAAVTSEVKYSPLVGLFRSGHVEIDAQVKVMGPQSSDSPSGFRIKSLSALERSLRRAATVEIELLSRGTGFLATTAASSPFIGLFGTVWGIMVAFQDIGLSGSTSLVAVAPGIAEALVNTALGLVAAIPALVGYNYFANRIRQFRAEMSDFTLEFLNLAEKIFT